MLSPAGPAAARLAWMGTFTFVVTGVVAAAMVALIVVGALRRSGSLEEHVPHDAVGGHAWIWIGGVVIPAITLAVFFVVGLLGLRASPLHDVDSEHAPEIVVTGHQFWWEVEYPGEAPDARLVTANEIHIPTGQPVEIELLSRDVIHSFWVPRLHGKVDLVPGQQNHIRIQADEPGVFEWQCAELCGSEHALMRLVVVAEDRASFSAWLRQSLSPAAAPSEAEPQAVAHGRALFLGHACASCHTIKGTLAGGRAGPDLTHIGSRLRIGANAFPNDRAHLEAWIARAQSLKPGVSMPDITEFTGEELRDLTAFLESLR